MTAPRRGQPLRWLVTGAEGMLGRELVAALAGEDVRAVGRSDVDITDSAAVRAAVEGVDVVLNAAAWTDVDGAEASERDAAAANECGPRTLARASRAVRARLVTLSTDYVFAGTARTPYGETHPSIR